MNRFGPPKGKKAIMMVLMVALLACILSLIVMTLWNEILVSVVGVQPLNIWQAAGLLLLSRILFGRMGPPPWTGRQGRGGHWREKWRNMSDEERHQLRQRWKDRCAPDQSD